MKTTMRHTALAIMAALLPMMTACIKDDVATQQADKVDLTLHFSTRGDSEPTQPDPNMKPEEGIRTLRVIITDADNSNNVIVNEMRDYSGETSLPTEKTLTILGLEAGTRNFYVVVNEAGVNLNFETSFPVGQPFNVQTFSRAPLNEPDVFRKGIPMAGQLTGRTLAEGVNTSLSIEVTRALARIDLTVNNLTGKELQVNEINFGAFFPVAGYLQHQTGTVLSSPKDFTENELIDKDDTHTFTYYLFEASGGTYTVGMKGSTDYDPAQIYYTENGVIRPVSRISRNEILQITANANASSWELSCTIAPWEVNEFTQEFSKTLVYTSYGWTPGTIVNRDGNVIELSADKEAELTFVIESPKGPHKWIASLSDTDNFELLTESGEPLFGGTDTQGAPIRQSLKLKQKPGAAKDAQAELRVYFAMGGQRYELDLTGDRQSHEGGEGEVNRFIIKCGGQ